MTTMIETCYTNFITDRFIGMMLGGDDDGIAGVRRVGEGGGEGWG